MPCTTRIFFPLLSGLGRFAVVVLIWSGAGRSDPLPARIKNITEHRDRIARAGKKEETDAPRRPRSRADVIKSIVQKLKLEQGKQINEIRLKLARAGYRSRERGHGLSAAAHVDAGRSPVSRRFFVIFVLQAFKMQAMMKSFLAVIIAVFFGLALPEIFLKNQSQKRETILRKAMPDALDLLVICAEAGLSLDAALDRVSREIGPSCAELAEEIGLTGVELGFYPDRAKALQNLADRVPLQGVVGLVNTLIQTEKYGTPLAQALRVLSAKCATTASWRPKPKPPNCPRR